MTHATDCHCTLCSQSWDLSDNDQAALQYLVNSGASLRRQLASARQRIETLEGALTSIQPLVDAVKKAIRDIRYTQAISGNGWVATELERALSRVVGEPK